MIAFVGGRQACDIGDLTLDFLDSPHWSEAFGLIKSSCKSAAADFFAWQNGILAQYGFSLEIQSREEKISSALSALLPLTSPIATRYLFWPVDENWTIYFDNGVGGTDAGPPQILSSRLSTDAVRVVMSPQQSAPETRQVISYGATILEYYREGNDRRTIFAANDGGSWKFGEYGEPFVFENKEAYSQRSKKDRFTHGMLLTYLSEIGVSLQNNPLLCGKKEMGYLLTKHGKMPENYREHTF
jgi:hypothetical protein